MTAKLLQDVLPIEEPINTSTIRQHIADVAERLEQELGDEQFCFVEGCQRSWDKLPSPDGPLTVGIDGGYVRGQHKQGQFEVIAGKSLLAFKRDQESKQQLSGRCFAWVQTSLHLVVRIALYPTIPGVENYSVVNGPAKLKFHNATIERV